jgi:hypothetical protein
MCSHYVKVQNRSSQNGENQADGFADATLIYRIAAPFGREISNPGTGVVVRLAKTLLNETNNFADSLSIRLRQIA